MSRQPIHFTQGQAETKLSYLLLVVARLCRHILTLRRQVMPCQRHCSLTQVVVVGPLQADCVVQQLVAILGCAM
jgi:hypothetical protein